jgi:tetratricopeptide (TPR) repeat protein
MISSGRSRAVIAAVAATIVMSAGISAREQPDSHPTATAGADLAAAKALRARGLQLGYDLDRQEALAVFKEAIVVAPADPTAYRQAAAMAWTALLFEQGAISISDYLGQARANVERRSPTAALAASFHDDLRRALALSEQRLRDHPSDADAHYQVGAVFGFLASYSATVEGRVLGSLGQARRAYQEHERALELDPRRKDAGLIVGMYRYGVSELPAPLRLLAHLAGFGGDRDRALHLIEDAARYPSDVQPNALFTLVLIYNREARYDEALRVIAELQGRFPRNRLLWLEAGSTALRAKRPAEARTALEEGLARLSQDTRPRAFGEEARWKYAYGATLVALKDVVPAERELRAALAGPGRDWVRGRVHQELGKLADLSEDRRRALDEYRLAETLCRQDHDSEGSEQAKTLMKTAYR